jgi:hypothetical protein
VAFAHGSSRGRQAPDSRNCTHTHPHQRRSMCRQTSSCVAYVKKAESTCAIKHAEWHCYSAAAAVSECALGSTMNRQHKQQHARRLQTSSTHVLHDLWEVACIEVALLPASTVKAQIRQLPPCVRFAHDGLLSQYRQPLLSCLCCSSHKQFGLSPAVPASKWLMCHLLQTSSTQPAHREGAHPPILCCFCAGALCVYAHCRRSAHVSTRQHNTANAAAEVHTSS